MARALDAQQVESVLRKIANPRDRALFWLIYDGGLRCQEALAIDIDDISWSERSIRIHGKGDRPREMFFSRAVSTFLDKYLARRGSPTSGPLFVNGHLTNQTQFVEYHEARQSCCRYARAGDAKSGD
ncbi:MAG: hypothetical protein NVS3B14_23810 [Ktedonobacteraceae bacterium]